MSEYVTTIANGDMDYVASPSGELLLFFPKERIHDAVSVARILNEETKTLQAELATANAALAEQSAKLKQQEVTIRHRDELLRIQGETIGRYEAALELNKTLALSMLNQTMDIEGALKMIVSTCVEALQETHEPSASKEALSEGEITE